MLILRKEQMEIFREAAMQRFENEMLQHLGEFSPSLFKTVGNEQMHKAVRFGITQAHNHGFTFRGPVQLYLELMLLFGSYFDTDPQYPWATEILTRQDSGSQMQRAEQLYQKAMDYNQKVSGPKNIYALDALRNIALMARQPLTVSANNFMPDMLQAMAFLYPQKAAYVGREGLEALIQKAMGGAKRQRFATVRGVVLVSVLMLAFGHGCAIDPLYPWIAKTFKDDTLTDPEARAKRLEKNALTWLDHVLVNFDKESQA